MAFTETIFRTLNGSFTAVGQSESSFTYAADVFVAGTFEGTVLLEAQDREGVWHTACEFTEPESRVIEWASRRPMRFNCTVFTSGEIDYILEPINEYVNAR